MTNYNSHFKETLPAVLQWALNQVEGQLLHLQNLPPNANKLSPTRLRMWENRKEKLIGAIKLLQDNKR